MKRGTNPVRRTARSGALAALLLLSPAWGVNDLVLTVAPGSSIVTPGDTVTVTLNAANLSAPINGVQALLRYDPAVLDLVSINANPLGLTPPASGWLEAIETDTAGDVVYSVLILSGGVSTDHLVATLTFDVVGEGATQVTFRADAPPFATKLTRQADNGSVIPAKTNSGTITSACSDGLFCNGVETFSGGSCQPGVDPCDDSVTCTVDSCDEGTDTCTNTPTDGLCDNGLFCDGDETCDALLGCQPGVFPCDDGVACTDDTCDEPTDTCVFTENDALCDDGFFCNGDELCDAVAGCLAGVNPCVDAVACTVDICDENKDLCVFTPNDTFCDNGVFCDGAEVCDRLMGCEPGLDPCPGLVCDEPGDFCFAPIHVAALEVFYNGRFANQPNPARRFLAAGGVANTSNIVSYVRGITGVRIKFDGAVTFATNARNALTFDWTTGTGTTFSPVTDAATMISATSRLESGATVIDVVIADHHVKKRWLRVTLDSAQVTQSGVALDGELAGNPISFPSGNGVPGGNAVFFIGNLTGDVDADRKVTLTDVGVIRGAVNPFVNVPITNVNDVDKDGKVQLADVGTARAEVNPFFTLPLIAP